MKGVVSMIIKEKNIITFIDDNNDKVGTYDINGATFYGKSGRALTKWSNKIQQVFRDDRNDCAIVKIAYNCADSYNEAYQNICKYGVYLDKIFNMGIPESALNPYSMDNFPIDEIFNEMIKNKDYIQKVKENQLVFTISEYKRYLCVITVESILSKYDYQFTETQIRALTSIYEAFGDEKYTDFCAKVIVNPKYHLDISINMFDTNIEPTAYEIFDMFKYYYRACSALGREYNSKDFFNDLHRVTQLYKIYISKSQDEIFTKHINPNVLSFEDENFIVICPKNKNDLVAEGQSMHNCVGSYYTRVVNGKCAIVFIRNKIAPDVSYITCEIGTDGIIRQYLESYNTRPSPLAHEFYKKYQDFLSSKKAEINKMLLC